jgi:hypothetical protein
MEMVLKVSRSAEAEERLLDEAAALEHLRHDHIVVLRRGVFTQALAEPRHFVAETRTVEDRAGLRREGGPGPRAGSVWCSFLPWVILVLVGWSDVGSTIDGLQSSPGIRS